MILDSTGRPVRSRKSSQPASFHQAFEAAKQSGYRGWFWFPSLDPGEQMPQMTREEIAKKSNWLYNNVGPVRAVIDGLALDEVDTGLWPKPATVNDGFNLAVKKLWNQQCGFRKAFSGDAENNFYSAQYLIRREIRLRGDCFGQKLRIAEGGNSPMMHFLPSWQCANSARQIDQSRWKDGRMDNLLGRALQYRFRVGDSHRDVSADDCIHFHDPFLIGQKRGVSALAPVVRQLFSMDDIERAATGGVLMRERVAYAIERTGTDEGGPSLLPGAVDVEEVRNPDGSRVIIQKIVARDGTELEVADLPANQKIKVVESVKSSEGGSWIKEILTMVAASTLYPVEYIFSLGGLSQGTLVRLAQMKVQRVLNTIRDFQLIMQFVDEWWPFWLWQNIAAGRLNHVKIPDDWWPYLIVRPKDLTVDVGREGRLYDDRVATGKMPVGLYVGMLYGEDDEEFDERIVRDRARRKKLVARIAAEEGIELTVDEVFRPPTGSAPVQAAPTEEEEDGDPKKKSQ